MTSSTPAPVAHMFDMPGMEYVTVLHTVDDMHALANRIADVNRALPVVVMTVPSGQTEPHMSVPAVGLAVGRRTLTYLVAEAGLCHALTDALRSHGLPCVYGGGVRVYRPHEGILRTSKLDHPLVQVHANDNEAFAIESIRAAVNAASRKLVAVPAPKPAAQAAAPTTEQTGNRRVMPLPGPPRAGHPNAKTTDAVKTTHPVPATLPSGSAAVPVPVPVADPPPPPMTRPDPALVSDLRELRQMVERLRGELRAEASRSAETERDNERLRQLLSETRKEVRRQGKDIASPRTIPKRAIPVVFTDPERQLRHEIYLTWLETVSEAERDRWPLREYQVGPDFLASLDTVNVARSKVLDVAVQVITRRVGEVTAREARKYGETEGQSPQRTRADGAAAWRANVVARRPQAARFVWWELPDGTVELGKAALHDDTTLR